MIRAAAILALVLLASCGQSMQRQQRAGPDTTTDAWPGGASARPLPEGVVAIGDAAWRKAESHPPRATLALVRRGRGRYDIFCSECHGHTGGGDGMIVQRGYPPPPSLNSAEARSASAKQLFAVISHGKGIMFPYAAQIPPRDRWAIIAYIRALQLARTPQAKGAAQ